jgi:hypothetical protein
VTPVESGTGRETTTLLLMSAACAALACAGWIARGPWSTFVAAVLTLAAGGVVTWCSLRRLRGIGRSAVGLSWTALPAVEAGFVAILAVRGNWIFGVVAAVFAAWGAIGCAWLFRRRGLPVPASRSTAEPVMQRIMKGSDLP